MREMAFALLFMIISVPTNAQVVGAGVGISRGCVGDSSGVCGAMWSAHASVWLDDKIELGFRFATLSLPDDRGSEVRYQSVPGDGVQEVSHIDWQTTGMSRRITTGDVTYHFRRGYRIRVFVGGGLGIRSEHFVQTCTPAGCELSFPVGHRESRSGNGTIIGGASARITGALTLRGGVRLHNLLAEGLSTTEGFLESDWQFHLR
jgi:hypothetical protein